MKETVFSKVVKYYHTIKYLKLIQIYGQLTIRFRKIKIMLVILAVNFPVWFMCLLWNIGRADRARPKR